MITQQRIKRGSTVRIVPEWREPHEADRIYVCIDEPEKGRVSVSPIEWEWAIRPIETVELRMLVTVEVTR